MSAYFAADWHANTINTLDALRALLRDLRAATQNGRLM